MNTMEQLAGRIDGALARIRAQAHSTTALNRKVVEMKAQRDKDIAEIDARRDVLRLP